MSNYTKTTNFAIKDSLASGNLNKLVKGTEINTEFDNIATAVATKANTASPSLTGTVTAAALNVTGNLDVDGTLEFDSISGTGSVAITDIADEDNMSSNSATKLATQQSIKAYVDSQATSQDLDLTDGTTSISIDLDSETLSVLGGTGVTSTASGNGVTLAIDSTVTTLTGSQTLTNKTLTSPDVNTPDIDGGTIDGTVIGGATAAAGSFTTVGATGNITVGGTVDGVDIASRDGVLSSTTTTAGAALPKAGGAMTGAITTNSTFDGRDVATDGTKLDGIEASATADQTDAQIRAAVEAATDSNVFTDADHTKLNAIEASADVTDTTNVTASGALMDSEVTNLAQVKAFASSDYATAAQGTLAAAALPKAGGAMTGAITTNSTFDGRDVATDGTKLDGIEASATADQTAAEIRTLVEAASDSNVFTDADHTKLNAIEASADVTDTANVTAAGALMDSEVTNLAQVKAFDSSDYATAAQGTLAAAALPKSGGAMTGAITTNSTFDGVDIATRDGVLSSTTTTANAALPKSGGAMTGAITTNSTFDGVDIATRDGVLTTTTNTANAALPKAGGTMTGVAVFAAGITEDAVTLSGTSTTIDISAATNFVHDLTGATTYTFSNPASDGNASSFTLKIIQGSTARAITWPNTVDWAGGTAPTLSSADNAVDVFVFYTIDGGTNYYGFTAGQAMA